MSGTKGKLLIQEDLEGLESPGPGVELLTAMGLLTCSLHPSVLGSGWDKGSSLGHRVPGMSALMHGACPGCQWHRSWGRMLLLWLGKAKAAGRLFIYEGYFLSHQRGLGKGWTWTARSDSTAKPHFFVPRGFLTSQHHPHPCLSHSQ